MKQKTAVFKMVKRNLRQSDYQKIDRTRISLGKMSNFMKQKVTMKIQWKLVALTDKMPEIKSDAPKLNSTALFSIFI